MVDLSSINTEEYNINSKNIELDDVSTIIDKINEEDKKVAYAVEKEKKDITNAIENILNHLNENSRIIYIGSGTSGRLGILDASECLPTYGVSKEFVQGIIAGGKEAVFEARENSEDNMENAIIDLDNISFNKNDVLIGIAASGRTPYVKSALNYAKSKGALTVAISCVKNAEISKIANSKIEVLVGPEIVAGSTRMKSGTAQKMILNMISTTVMIKLSKVYSGYMVDMKLSNEKLRQRAKNIFKKICECNDEVASKYLEKSDNNLKIAIYMKLSNINDINIAKNNLEKYKNNLTLALNEMAMINNEKK